MKILHAFRLFSLQTGGGTVDLMHKVMRALCERGHEVTLYTSDYKIDQEYLSMLIPIKVVVMHSALYYKGFYVMPELDKVARENVNKFDVIHLHAQRSLLHTPICHYAIQYGVPYVIDAHGSTPMFNKVLAKRVYDSLFGKYIYDNCSQFIAENRLGEKEYIDLGIVTPKITVITPPKDRITIINPPLAVERFDELPSDQLFRRKFNLPGKKVIMFMGRIHKVKGINYLIDGFNELLKIRRDAALVIVGSDDGDMGNLKRQVKSLGIGEYVLFTGFLSGSEKLSALVAADVAAQTSIYEQGAWCPMEAMLCGTPVVISSHTGAGQDIEDTGGGYLVDIYNAQEMASTINYVLDNQEEAREKAKNGAEYIRRNLSLTTSIAKYEAVYEKCLNVKR